ncbi:MAG: hypothetical protein K0U54_12140, partial [Bacteroidetes bacterium]|nr:hypothetical protein [Bacteroidota bacterium]
AYTGDLGGISINLVRTIDNTLSFQVPQDVSAGTQQLIITGLPNLVVNYDVMATELEGTPEEVLTDFFSGLTAYRAGLSNNENDTEVENYFIGFDGYYNEANTLEREQMALFYQANKQMVDDLLAPNFTGNQELTDNQLLVAYLASVLIASDAIVVGGAALQTGNLPAASIATGVSIIAWTAAWAFYDEFQQRKIKVVGGAIDGITSELDNLQNNFIELNHSETSSFSFEENSRDIIANDQSSGNSNLNSYFERNDVFNGAINTLNAVIEFVNDNIWFSNIPTKALLTVPDSQPLQTDPASQEYFDNFQFSTSDSNVTIDQISFDNGQISMRAYLTNPDQVNEYLDTTLDYTYQDDFNQGSGSFPVRVNNEVFDYQGTWIRYLLNPDGSNHQIDRIIFDELGNADFREADYLDGNGYQIVENMMNISYANGQLILRNLFFGTANSYEVLQVDDTVFFRDGAELHRQ